MLVLGLGRIGLDFGLSLRQSGLGLGLSVRLSKSTDPITDDFYHE